MATKKRKRVARKKGGTVQLANYLKLMCPKSIDCTVFGKDTEKVVALFQGFREFTPEYKYKLYQVMTEMGESNNGKITGLSITKFNYSVNTIIKSKSVNTADSLLYEGIVGEKFINPLIYRFPCFLETYGTYAFFNTKLKTMINTKTYGDYTPSSVIQHLLQTEFRPIDPVSPQSFGYEAHNSTNIAILQEYLEHPMRVETFIETMTLYEFENVLPLILYQIYKPLSCIADEFTHYDLHDDNVLLYKVPNDKYVCMTYAGQQPFYTQYIVKIIDYGRCYFHCSSKLNSTTIVEKEVNNTPFLTGSNEYYIDIRKPNKSIDLRFIYCISLIIGDMSRHNPLNQSMQYLISHTVFGQERRRSNQIEFGTQEVLETVPNKIVNVYDVVSYLENEVFGYMSSTNIPAKKDVLFTMKLDTHLPMDIRY